MRIHVQNQAKQIHFVSIKWREAQRIILSW